MLILGIYFIKKAGIAKMKTVKWPFFCDRKLKKPCQKSSQGFLGWPAWM